MMNKIISNALPYFPKGFVWQFSKKYVAGESIPDAIHISQQLNEKGIAVTVDLLGEFITELHQARENTEMYLQIIESFTAAGINGSFSLKPTSFGLLLDAEACYQNVRQVVEKATKYGCFVRIDMEDSSCTDIELTLFNRLRTEFPNNVAIVLQAYMRRTLNDIKQLQTAVDTTSPLNIRLCKGIYVEPEEIAFKEYEEVRAEYLKDLDYMLQNNVFAAIATHDRYLIEQSMVLLQKHQTPKNQYEFQMLYGVAPNLRDEVVNAGHPMRVYVPFGKDWFAYCTRRLKENPKMATDIIKGIFIKR